MIAGSLQGVVTQTLLPTLTAEAASRRSRSCMPDDAIRNLIRQGKVEQIYSYMQTGSRNGMQTLEQSLADLVLRAIVSRRRGDRPLESPRGARRPAPARGCADRQIVQRRGVARAAPGLRLAEV